MNNFKLSVFMILSILLTSCATINSVEAPTSTPTYTLTPPPTATVTFTPVPLANLEGTIFFDHDGSGIQDEGEPPLVGYSVCEKSKNLCAVTDNDGHFVFENIAPDGTRISLSLVDPNSDNAALTFRYVNIWKKSVIIPPYEIDGVSIPEQHLNDTQVFPIKTAMDSVTGKENNIGLSQGFFTLPFDCQEKYTLFAYFDLDKSGGVRNYLGDTHEFQPDQVIGTSDSHPGVDFKIPVGKFLYAFASGRVTNGDNGRGALWVAIYNDLNLNAHIGHISKYLVKDETQVYRGQIIALSGSSGTKWPHVHMQLGEGVDFFRDTQSPNSISYWTVDNNPICMNSGD